MKSRQVSCIRIRQEFYDNSHFFGDYFIFLQATVSVFQPPVFHLNVVLFLYERALYASYMNSLAEVPTNCNFHDFQLSTIQSSVNVYPNHYSLCSGQFIYLFFQKISLVLKAASNGEIRNSYSSQPKTPSFYVWNKSKSMKVKTAWLQVWLQEWRV